MKPAEICLLLTVLFSPAVATAQTPAPNDAAALADRAYAALVRGQDDEALKLLQEAVTLAPEDPRAHLYLAIAFYRLGRVDEARLTLGQSQTLDPNNPLPWLVRSMINVDLFNAGLAVAAAAEAHARRDRARGERLFTDLEGSADPARAFAFAGLDEWAEHVAQESIATPTAARHFVLSDRYEGLLNKRSELIQGLLIDPTAFGASPRFQTLLPRQRVNGVAGFRLFGERGVRDVVTSAPYGGVNGLAPTRIPVAYAVDFTRGFGDADDMTRRIPSTQFAIGLAPSPRSSVFAMVDKHSVRDRYNGAALPGSIDDDVDAYDHDAHRVDVGVQYRFSPTSALSLKLGTAASDTVNRVLPVSGEEQLLADEYNSAEQLQFRHTFAWTDRASINFGAESSTRRRELDLNLFIPAPLHQDVVTDSESADFSARIRLSSALSLDARLGVTRTTDGVQNVPVNGEVVILSEETKTHPTPRLGFVYRITEGRVARLVYQRWIRSASDSTLAPIAIAGIAPDDRLLVPNGLADGGRAQVDWTWNASTFLTAFADYQQLTNPNTVGHLVENIPLTSEWAIQRVTRTMRGHSAMDELFETGPAFRKGDVASSGFGWNYLFDPEWSARVGYVFTASRSRDGLVDDEALFAPVLPRHTFAFGGTWTSARRIQAAADFRFVSDHSVSAIDRRTWQGHWETSLRASWEPLNKRWAVDFLGRNLGAAPTEYFESATFGLNIKFRY